VVAIIAVGVASFGGDKSVSEILSQPKALQQDEYVDNTEDIVGELPKEIPVQKNIPDKAAKKQEPKGKTDTGVKSTYRNTEIDKQSFVSKEMGVSFNYPNLWKAEYKKVPNGTERIILTSPDYKSEPEKDPKGEIIIIRFDSSWVAGPESENTTAQEYVNIKMDYYTKNPLTKGVIQQTSFKNQVSFFKRTLTAPGVGSAWTVYGGKEFSVMYIYPEWTPVQEIRFNIVISNLTFFAPAVSSTR